MGYFYIDKIFKFNPILNAVENINKQWSLRKAFNSVTSTREKIQDIQ